MSQIMLSKGCGTNGLCSSLSVLPFSVLLLHFFSEALRFPLLDCGLLGFSFFSSFTMPFQECWSSPGPSPPPFFFLSFLSLFYFFFDFVLPSYVNGYLPFLEAQDHLPALS